MKTLLKIGQVALVILLALVLLKVFLFVAQVAFQLAAFLILLVFVFCAVGVVAAFRWLTK